MGKFERDSFTLRRGIIRLYRLGGGKSDIWDASVRSAFLATFAQVRWRWLAGALVASVSGADAAAAETPPVRMVLVSTVEYTAELRVEDNRIAQKRPGYRAELLMEAAKRCGAEIEFSFMPWQRGLLLVQHGAVDGAFSASYSDERAEYGVYPMANGRPDTARALKGYSYSLYVPHGSSIRWDGKTVSGVTKPIAVERGSAGAKLVGALGLPTVELPDNASMLRMLAGERVAGITGITSDVDALIAGNAQLAATVRKEEPPLEVKFGYVLLSKKFYGAHGATAECFWTAIRDIRRSPEHQELIRSYTQETP